jgi:hypothetical protein
MSCLICEFGPGTIYQQLLQFPASNTNFKKILLSLNSQQVRCDYGHMEQLLLQHQQQPEQEIQADCRQEERAQVHQRKT